ncbi:hypothetical protein CEP54_002996 [Fusarium duplospermum]|uniref:Protein kinase domain-containing protein n=1 Tax=Fusarium duplospermum TaxID=1325734 RepID=A0A428QRP6_9HYPO|nr:hypothetical protein CEP54_002996 [Fusarium duplospermum]
MARARSQPPDARLMKTSGSPLGLAEGSVDSKSMMLISGMFMCGRFIPHGNLTELLHFEAIEEELGGCSKLRFDTKQHELKAQALEICGAPVRDLTTVSGDTLIGGGCVEHTTPEVRSYKKILAILVLINRRSKIRYFLQAGICDADLPLVLVKRTDSVASWALQPGKANDISPGRLKGWSKSKVTYTKFLEWQWVVLAPSFTSGQEKMVPHQSFQDRDILPFTSWEILVESKSTNVPIQAVAVKRLKSQNDGDFEREVNITRRFSDNHHKNLVCLLATYKQHDEFNLIFPYAECNLLGYWRQVNPNPSSKDGLSWLAEQCRGLADGLAYIHRYSTSSFRSLLHPNSFPLTSFTKVPTPDNKEVCQLFGRHGDIKPENILWFSGPRPFTENSKGILKITDFGIAEFSTKPAVDRKRRGHIPNSPTYCAPEIDLPVQVGGGPISPSYDIWALGCVYLQFITWWLGSWDYVEKFASRRLMPDPYHWSLPLNSDKFFTIQKNSHTGRWEAQVKDVVSQVSISQTMRVYL